VYDTRQLAPPVAFFHLAVDQSRSHLPLKGFAPTTPHLSPVSKMGCESIKVQIEAITGKEWETAKGQAQPQSVDEPMRHVLRAGTQLEDGQNLGAGIDGQPEPEYVCGAAEAGA
jgi:hypothetical protein